ncbi:DUF5799 family protein [Halomarina oriensis]|uniref:Uncharacterized protein n=1 Tax=Halomarina oriensis TaxID=671145 RepID=A0A6B0GVE2_9EURY|nr:DUF5799 family protein [Halomarina oriensis]MWG35688.1 hypothetical protein [Halomarina oriensis]
MSWTDRLVGARMAQDREFGDRVAESSLSHQEWNLVMTATEFRIEDVDDPEQARLVGDTSKLPSVVPEMDRIASEQPDAQREQSSGGMFGSIKSALGMGGGGGSDDAERTAAAEELVDEYTTQLQNRLEANGRWEEIRQVAAEERDRK